MTLSLIASAASCCGSQSIKGCVEKSEKPLFWLEAAASVTLVVLGVLARYGGPVASTTMCAEVMLISGVANSALVFFVAKCVLHKKLGFDNLLIKGGEQ